MQRKGTPWAFDLPQRPIRKKRSSIPMRKEAKVHPTGKRMRPPPTKTTILMYYSGIHTSVLVTPALPSPPSTTTIAFWPHCASQQFLSSFFPSHPLSPPLSLPPFCCFPSLMVSTSIPLSPFLSSCFFSARPFLGGGGGEGGDCLKIGLLQFCFLSFFSSYSAALLSQSSSYP